MKGIKLIGLKRTVNVEDSSIDVVDFSTVITNSSELNSLQLLETLDKNKLFAIIPNGTVVSSTNFDSTLRPRSVYKVIELTDMAVIENVINTAITAGLIEEETPETATKPKK